MILLSLVLFTLHPLNSQELREKQEQVRRDKLEMILRIKDLRTQHDNQLVSSLADADPVVRLQATLACGSIQDTSVVSLLEHNLTDEDPRVQEAAAWSIGQTGEMLSPKGREALAYDLIWKRLFQTGAAERLIEEIGKFGGADALSDLMLKVGNVFPPRFSDGMTMSVARFAIRGIVSPDAVRYLLRFIRPPESTPWKVLYALQRIGDNPVTRDELEALAQLYTHRDPLVRMNLAVLLGKLHDPRTCLDPLQKLAEIDSDWRVRVNALRALAGFDLHAGDTYVRTFERALFDENEYIALTAISALGGTSVSDRDTAEVIRETLSQLEYIARNASNNFPWQEQAAACAAIAELKGPAAFPLLVPRQNQVPELQAALLNALGRCGAETAGPILLDAAKSDRPLIACAALQGLERLAHGEAMNPAITDTTRSVILHALTSSDVSVVATAASILGDSLFLGSSSVPSLVASLADRNLTADLEAIQEIIATLGKSGDRRAIPALMDELKKPYHAVAIAAAAALKQITGMDYRSGIRPDIEPLVTDFDFAFLRSLPPRVTVRLETVRGDANLEFFTDVAPFTVLSTLKLLRERGFFRGIPFHRVVPNFVVQAGDPRGDGWGGPGYSIRSEFSPLRFEEGTVGMASAGKDTEGSQFFITQSPQPHLDGRYTIVGRVVAGMEVIDRLQAGDRILDMVRVAPGDPVAR